MAAMHAPHLFINRYMQDKFAELSSTGLPFLPTLPSDFNGLSEIDILTETQGTQTSGEVVAVYDRMFKLRRKAFPHIKCEQLLYYFYSYGVDDLYRLQQQAQDLLDGGDESAETLNVWIRNLWVAKGEPIEESTGKAILYFGDTEPDPDINGNPDTSLQDVWFYLPYFHEIKIFQLEESRDIVDFGTARTWAGNKLIVDYDWHSS